MSEFSLDDPSFYEDFLVEAGEHFELIEQNFLTLEEAPGDLEILNAIFRSVHTIKGASGFLGLAKVQALAHIGENILDLFGGSGSTLIGCEQTERRAFLMELDAPYCDVIVKRWEEFTGKKAELVLEN